MALVNLAGVEILFTCKNLQVPGISYDGGYADYMIAPIGALA